MAVGDLSFALGPQGRGADKKRALAEAMMGTPKMPQDVGQGLAALGDAFRYRQMKRGDFPDAPGGAPAGIGTMFRNRLGMNRGGLY